MGAAAQLAAFDDAAGYGQHVLDRPADLGPDQVAGPVGAEAGQGDGLGQGAALVGVGAGQGHRRGQVAGHVGGEAGAGQHRRRGAGQGLGQHLGHQLQRAALHPLGAQHHRGSGAQVRGQGGQGGAHVLGGAHGQDQVAMAQVGHVLGGLQRVLQGHARQEQGIFVFAVDGVDHLGLARPQQGGQARAGAHLGQGRAPGPAADHPGAGKTAHALAPLRPGTWVGLARAAASSSGQRGRAAASRPSVRPRARRSAPARAIIAALSVQ